MPEWIQFATSVGAGGVLAAWLWFERQRVNLEREERLAIQKANDVLRDQLVERVLRALLEGESAVRDVTASLESLKLIIESLRGVIIAQHGGDRT